MRYDWGSSSTSAFEGPWSSYSPFFHRPQSTTSTLQKDHVVRVPREWSRSSRTTTSMCKPEDERDRSFSRPFVISVSKSTLGLERSERSSIIGYSASLSRCTSIPKSRRIESRPIQTKINSRSPSPGHLLKGRVRTRSTVVRLWRWGL